MVEPSRLVFHHGDEIDGKMANAFLQTVTFDEVDGHTRLTMESTLATAEEFAAVVGFGAIELGSQTLRRLGAHLASQR